MGLAPRNADLFWARPLSDPGPGNGRSDVRISGERQWKGVWRSIRANNLGLITISILNPGIRIFLENLQPTRNLQKPREDAWLLKRRTAEQTGKGIAPQKQLSKPSEKGCWPPKGTCQEPPATGSDGLASHQGPLLGGLSFCPNERGGVE